MPAPRQGRVKRIALLAFADQMERAGGEIGRRLPPLVAHEVGERLARFRQRAIGWITERCKCYRGNVFWKPERLSRRDGVECGDPARAQPKTGGGENQMIHGDGVPSNVICMHSY